MFLCVTGPIWLDDLECSYGQEILDDCDHRGWGVHNCDHDDDVGVICNPGESTPDSIIQSHA